jgi:hypothetical protein
MKTRNPKLSVVLSTLMLSMLSLFFVGKARAFQENNKKQLQGCLVQDGDTVTQLGNSCISGGKGCTPNPCGN